MTVTKYETVHVFRPGCEQASEIWKSSDHVESSYEGLKFHGEASKFAASPRQPGIMGEKTFDNLSSPMSQDDSV